MTISFIILDYHSATLTARCAGSIRQHIARTDYEIIVVGNDTTPQARQALARQLAPLGCTVVGNRGNTGFGSGNMLGANAAQGRYLCFLNSDITFDDDCITPLVDYLEAHPDVALIIPQEHNREGRPVPSFKHDFGIRHDLLGDGLFERWWPSRFPSRRQFGGTSPYDVPQTSGCFMLLDADKFWQAGGFDTNLFLYYEEYDLCRRLHRKGWRTMVHPAYHFNHLHGASTPQSPAIVRERYVSKLYCYRKHHGLLLSWLFKWVNIALLLGKPRKWHVLPVVLRGEALSRSMRHNPPATAKEQ